MKQTQFYIGLYQNDQETIFFKQNNDTYYDIKAKRKVSSSEIQLSSLVPYNHVIKGNPKFTKNRIKLYDLDRVQKIALNRLFIGDICKINDVPAFSVYYHQDNNGIEKKVSGFVNTIVIKKDALLLTSDMIDPYVNYDDLMDLETGNIYQSDFDFVCGSQYVPRSSKYLKTVKQVLRIESDDIEKGKLLEKYRNWRNN